MDNGKMNRLQNNYINVMAAYKLLVLANNSLMEMAPHCSEDVKQKFYAIIERNRMEIAWMQPYLERLEGVLAQFAN